MTRTSHVIADLGHLEGDVLLFGGPYSNLQATQALFSKIGHVPKSNRICTGDLVAYCADPAATAALVLEQVDHVVAGNCELQLAAGAQDCGCGFEEGSVCDLAAKGWFPFASSKISAEQREAFAALPDLLVFEHIGRRYAVIHGGHTDVARFIWPTDTVDVFREEVAAVEALVGEVEGIVCGHSGVPFERHIDGRVWINAGVIGMPPHDGRPQTRYAVLGEDGVRFCQLEYDCAGAANAMQLAGLCHGYEKSLETGIWPSEDVLPNALRW